MRKQWLLEKSVGFASRVAPGPAGRLAFRAFCTPPRRNTPSAGEVRLHERMSPVMAEATSAFVTAASGRIRTYHWPAAPGIPALGRVLLVHGWTGRALVMGAFVAPLRAAGFDVVALDLPAHGESTGTTLNLAIGARALQAVEHEMGPFHGAIAHSFGGPITLLAAEGGLPLSRAMPLNRLVLIASPNSLERITSDFANAIGLGPRARAALDAEVMRIAGRPAPQFRCDHFLARVQVPALVIHDEDDVEVPIANAEEIVAGNPSAELLRTTRLGHRRIIVTPAVVRAATAHLLAPDQK